MSAITLDAKLPVADSVPVVKKHHWLVRITHWANVPILLGMILSGVSVYWAAPIYHHAPIQVPDSSPLAGNTDYLQDIGVWIVHIGVWFMHHVLAFAEWMRSIRLFHIGVWIKHHVPLMRSYRDPVMQQNWVYDHLGLGTGLLSDALNIHWFFAYLFMLNGLLYIVGLILGGGYRALLPRRTDLRDAVKMQIYYVGLPFAKILRRPWPHPHIVTKYNALQRLAYGSMPVCGTLSVLTGWAIHKPQQLGWLQGLFGGYDYARVWHFWLMWVFIAFVVPHVILVFADGWDTFRSMVVGWSDRVPDRPPPPPQ